MSLKFAPVKAEFINPFVSSAIEVFRTMLDCELKRGELYLKGHNQPDFDISGVVGLSGKASGAAVVSLGKQVALRLT